MDLQLAAQLAPRLSALLFVALAFAALRVQRRHRDEASKWLVVAFTTLAGALALGQTILPDVLPVLQTLVVLGVLAFPLLLLQFTAAFDPMPRWARILPAVVLALLAGWTPVVVPLSPVEASAAERAWLATFLGYFLLVGFVVAIRLWRAGTGQPTIARRRMRTLAVATVLLSLALLVSGATGDEPAATVLVHGLAVLSTALFAVAFLPPPFLRASWRAKEEDELYRAALRLMATTSVDDVVDVLLPHLTRVVGGHDAELRTLDGEFLGRHGGPRRSPAGEALEVTLTHIRLRVGVSPYTPFFGEDEGRLLLRLGLLADLALDRADLLTREQAAREEIERVNDELESFVYSASHDLKTPLITILGFLDVLQEDPAVAATEEGGFYLERLRANAAYMQELIADLLELSRIGRSETAAEPIDLGELLGDIAEGIHTVHPHVTVVAEGELPVICINRTRARQLIGNLIENSARYGGRPDVRVTVSGGEIDDRVELRVRDDGVGVPQEHRERVFGVFERGSSAEGGTGIGLAICRKIVAELDGGIRFVDRDDGAEVLITLPSDVLAPR